MPTVSVMRDRDRFVEAIRSSETVKEALSRLGLRPTGSNYKALYKACEVHEITAPDGAAALRRNCLETLRKKRPLEEVMVENSDYSRGSLKKRILRENLIPYQCKKCGSGPWWQGEELSLHLDHINGVWNDHRFENLRFLCPNCHAQTSTYGGKNVPRSEKPPAQPRATKIDWPDTGELVELVEVLGFRETGKRLGVSDNAVRKRLKTHFQVG